MTESEWLASTDPRAMVEAVRGKASNRKLRLFVLAVSWLIGPTKDQSGLLKARANAERMAEGDVPGQWSEKFWVDNPNAIGAAQQAVWSQSPRMAAPIASLLRDIVGNPFRPVTLAACNCGSCVAPGRQHHNGPCAVRRLRTPTARAIAQAAYDDRDEATGHLDPLRLAILADALEEAGCPQTIQCHRCDGNGQQFFSLADGGIVCKDGVVRSGWKDCPRCDGSSVEPHPLLTHLRSPGPHVRGCWAVDLVLGRE